MFVNGQKAGYHESGYTAWDMDLTGLLKPGQRNLFAVRVCKQTPSVDCDTGDFQTMGGIYRDTSLIAVPETRVSDITVRTPLTANYKDATLLTQLSVQGDAGPDSRRDRRVDARQRASYGSESLRRGPNPG